MQTGAKSNLKLDHIFHDWLRSNLFMLPIFLFILKRTFNVMTSRANNFRKQYACKFIKIFIKRMWFSGHLYVINISVCYRIFFEKMSSQFASINEHILQEFILRGGFLTSEPKRSHRRFSFAQSITFR